MAALTSSPAMVVEVALGWGGKGKDGGLRLGGPISPCEWGGVEWVSGRGGYQQARPLRPWRGGVGWEGAVDEKKGLGRDALPGARNKKPALLLLPLSS